MNSLPVIAWDIDDVLNEYTVEWLRFFRDRRPECAVGYDELTENPPTGILGLTLNQYRESLDEFRGRYMLELRPRPEMLEWFEAWGDRYRHLVVTAVPMKFAHLSAHWVLKHFGRWMRSVNVVPSPRDDDRFVRYDRTKGDMLARLGQVDLFVDDAEPNLESARHLPLRTIIFPAPWNRRAGRPASDVTRELCDYLNHKD